MEALLTAARSLVVCWTCRGMLGRAQPAGSSLRWYRVAADNAAAACIHSSTAGVPSAASEVVKRQHCKASPAKGAAIEAMQQQHCGSARACWPPLLVVQPDAVYCDKLAVSICQSFGADCVSQWGWRSLREGLHQALEPGNSLLPELLSQSLQPVSRQLCITISCI